MGERKKGKKVSVFVEEGEEGGQGGEGGTMISSMLRPSVELVE